MSHKENVDRSIIPLIGKEYWLTDDQHHLLGTVIVCEVETLMISGTFRPGRDYPGFRALFASHSSAVDDMIMTKVEALDVTISKLRLRLLDSDYSVRAAVKHVIIREESDIFFHVAEEVKETGVSP